MLFPEEFLLYENLFECIDPCAFDDFDIDSDLQSDLSPSDVEPVLENRSKGSRKRKNRSCDSESVVSSSSSSSPSKSRRIAPKSFPVVAPMKYANYLVSAINEQDSEKLEDCLKQICAADAKITMNIYNVKEFQKGATTPTNHFGDFQTATLSLNEFVTMQKYMHEIVPDEYTEITSSKCCFESNTSSVYISCFRTRGTILSQDSKIGSGDKNGNLTGKGLVRPNKEILKSSAACKYSRPFVAEGSLIMYRNEAGKMTEIEFCYEYSE